MIYVRRPSSGLRRLARLSLVLLAIVSCVRDGTGPDPFSPRVSSGITFRPVFQLSSALGTSAFDVVDFDRVRVVLTRLNGVVAIDTVIVFPAGSDVVSVSLSVPISPGAPPTGELLSLDLEYQNSAGVTVFRGGPVTVTAVPAGGSQPPPVEIPVRYTGPGANATQVRIAPRTLTVSEGGAFAFTGGATDAAGAPVPTVPIAWTSLDPARATVTSPVAGVGVAVGPRGMARIVAQLLTGGADTVLVTVLPRARTLAAVSGAGQSAIAGAELAQPLVVRVTASDGLGVSGVSVGFAVASGGGSVGSPAAVTDTNGLAQTTWRLGATVGPQSVTAIASGLTGSPVTFGATGNTIVPTRLVVTAQPSSTGVGQTLSTVSVAAQDAAGNLASSFTGPVSIAFGANPGGATLAGTTTVNAAGGIAGFSTLSVSRAGTGYTLVASSAGLANATTSAFDVAVGAPRVLEFSLYPTSVTAGTTLPPITVVARDSAGNVASTFSGSVTLTLAASPVGATIVGTTTVAAVAGVATFGALSLPKAGTYRFGAQSTGLNGVTGGAFPVNAGPATLLALVSGGGQSAAVSTTLPAPVVVQVTDDNGNAVAGAGRSVTFSVASGGGNVAPTGATTDAQGRASANWTLGPTVGAQSLAVSSVGLTPNPLAVGATATGQSNVATQLAFSSQPSSAVAGAANAPAIVVVARDGQGATATSFSGSVTLALGANQGGATLSGTLSAVAVNGVATFSDVRLDRTGTGYTLVATAAGLTGATSNPFDITAGSAAQLFFTVQPSSVAGGAAIGPAVQVTARDASGNTATAFAGTVTLALGANQGGGTLSGTLGAAAVNGVATFSNVRIDRAATGYTLVATATGTTAATSGAFNVTAGSAAGLFFTVQPSTATGGAALVPPVQVTARDSVGNTAIGFAGSVTVTLGANQSGATLSGTLSVAAVNGVATFSNVRLDRVGTGYTLVASASGVTNGTSAAFDIIPASASRLVFSVQPSSTAAGGTITPAVEVTARDSVGNTVTSFTGNVTVAIGTNPGGATLTGTTTVAAVAGVARFTDLALTTRGIGFTLTASAASLVGATSGAFDVTAVSISWTNVAGGSWKVPSNWSLGRLPLPTDSVVIALAGTYTVTLDTTFTATNMEVGGGAGTQTLAMTSRTLTINGAMIVRPGGQLQATASTVTGPGSLTNQGVLTVTGGAINTALINQGTLSFADIGTFAGAFTAAQGSMLRLQGNGSYGAAQLTITNGFTNSGTIELTDIVSSYGATLTVTNGTLVNDATGVISALAGTNGPRTIAAMLNNQGTITVAGAQGMTLSKASAAQVNNGTINVSVGNLTVTQTGTAPSFTNAGTLTVSAGRTMAVTGGAFTLQAGATLNGGGAMTLTSVTSAAFNAAFTLGAVTLTSTTASFATNQATASTALSFTASVVNGPGTITNAAGQTMTVTGGAINTALINQGTLVFADIGTFAGAFTAAQGSTLRLQGNGSYGAAQLTVTNGFTNSGTIELTDIVSAYGATLTVTNGTLVNDATGVVNALAGTNGPRTIAALLDNQGTITVGGAQGMTLAKASAAHTNSGTINVSGGNLTVTQTGTTPSFTNAGTLTVSAGRAVNVTGGVFTLQAGATLNGGGAMTLASVTSAAFNTAFTLGAVTLTSTTASFATNQSNASTALSFTASVVNGPGTITNAPGQTMTVTGGTINTALINQGTLNFADIGTFAGAFTAAQGSMLRLQGNGSYGAAQLTVTNGFTNSGTIELTDIVSAYGATLTVTNGTLVNDTIFGAINALAGTNGPRTIAALLNNRGTITVSGAQGMTLAKASAAHTNSGTINVSGGNLTVTQTGTTPSFTNAGTLAVSAGRTVTVTGGAFTLQAGATLNGGGAMTLTSVTAAAFNAAFTLGAVTLTSTTASFATNQSSATTVLSFTASVVNGPGTITNAAGQTMAVTGGTINAPLVNQGTLNFADIGTFAGAFTAAQGSMLRLQGNGSYGAAQLTVTSGFTNSGTIELTDIVSSYGATLTVTGGPLVNDSTGFVTPLAGAGGPRTIVAAVTNLGTLALTPGTAGTLTITGSLNTSGTVNLELGGLAAGTQYDRLVVSGAVTFGGTLNATLINGFVPASGNSFTVTTYGSGTGRFGIENLPAGFSQAAYGATALVLTRP